MANELTRVEFQSISGIPVVLDADTVINFCTRGNGEITPQEVALFLRTCQAKKLDPLENGEVYLIKYDNSKPAQIVVGKHAYNRRADRNPEYRGKKSGVTIVRDNQVIQKEGCCVYAVLGEKLIGGWCRVYRQRPGAAAVEETYREVALEEYSSGQANWKVKPATMIEKVAVSQCLREAFPNDYEGLYSEDEMVAAGAIPVNDYHVIDGDGQPADASGEEDPAITQDQRQTLFRFAREHFGKDAANDMVKNAISEFGLTNTTAMTVSVYEKVMERLNEYAQQLADSDGSGQPQEPPQGQEE